jgi:hypothetical protein
MADTEKLNAVLSCERSTSSFTVVVPLGKSTTRSMFALIDDEETHGDVEV